MTATEVMAELERLGVQLEIRGERLRYCPGDAVDDDLRQSMKEFKSEIINRLRMTLPTAEASRHLGDTADQHQNPAGLPTPRGAHFPSQDSVDVDTTSSTPGKTEVVSTEGTENLVPTGGMSDSGDDAIDDPDWHLRFAYDLPRPDGNWNDYSTLRDADREHLMAPLEGISKCPWCGRRGGNHTQPSVSRLGCVTLCDEWIIEMPLGQYRGLPIREIGNSYLTWLQRKVEQGDINVAIDVRDEIDRVLRARRKKP